MVSRRIDHAKPSTTLDIYGHLYLEMQAEAARIMDDLVMPLPVDALPSEHQQFIAGDNQAKHLQQPQHCTIAHED